MERFFLLGRLLFIFWFSDPPTFFFFQNTKKKQFYGLIFILPSDVTILASLILKQGVQGLQAFSFCIFTVNDEHTNKPRFKTKCRG